MPGETLGFSTRSVKRYTSGTSGIARRGRGIGEQRLKQAQQSAIGPIGISQGRERGGRWRHRTSKRKSGKLQGDADNSCLLAALGLSGWRRATSSRRWRALSGRLAPGEPRILCDFGAALTTAGRLEQVEPALRSGLMLFPDDNLRFNLARCLQPKGDLAGGP